MGSHAFLVGLTILGVAAAPADASDRDATSAPLHTLQVSQGPGVDLPSVNAVLAGVPHGPFMIFAEVGNLAPFALEIGHLDASGDAKLNLKLPAVMLANQIVYRAAFAQRGRAVLSAPAPLDLTQSGTNCQTEDWEDHDCGTGAGCDPDGDSPSAPGQILSAQWEDEWGYISAVNFGNGPSFPVIFDSASPTGGDDDLATPTIDDGDGCNLDHDGGGSVFPGDPCKPFNHVVIIQENGNGCGDGFCDTPDDEAAGGVITIDFRFLVELCSMDLLDIDEAAGAEVRTSCSKNAGCGEIIAVPPGPDNCIKRVYFSSGCIDRVDVEFSGSGAIAEFEYAFCEF